MIAGCLGTQVPSLEAVVLSETETTQSGTFGVETAARRIVPRRLSARKRYLVSIKEKEREYIQLTISMNSTRYFERSHVA